MQGLGSSSCREPLVCLGYIYIYVSMPQLKGQFVFLRERVTSLLLFVLRSMKPQTTFTQNSGVGAE